MRDGLEIWSGLALRHTDRNQVLPFREYEYVLKVSVWLRTISISVFRAGI